MSASRCVIVDYGIGNVFSVGHALRSRGAEVALKRDAAAILSADRVILPGVGAFGRAADRLRDYGLDETLLRFIETGRPFLGICVGMQLLMTRGHEFGVHDGLGVIAGEVRKVSGTGPDGQPLRVPLIGWYPVEPGGGYEGTLMEGAPAEDAYYFVHSYAAEPDAPEDVLAFVRHGDATVTAVARRDNVVGTQFHPERSGEAGLALLDRFLSL